MTHTLSIKGLRRIIREEIGKVARTPPGGSGQTGPSVFVVFADASYEGSEIVGIFSSEAKAREAMSYIEDDIEAASSAGGPRPYEWGDSHRIEEFQLDALSEEVSQHLAWKYKPRQQSRPAVRPAKSSKKRK